MPDNWDFSQPVRRRPAALDQTPFITYVLIGLSVVFSLINFTHPEEGAPAYRWLQLATVHPWDIWSGHFAGLFTCFFVHVNWLHLLFDMLWLYRLGSVVELTI